MLDGRVKSAKGVCMGAVWEKVGRAFSLALLVRPLSKRIMVRRSDPGKNRGL